MNPIITIITKVPVFTIAQLNDWNKEQLLDAAKEKSTPKPIGYDYPPLFFLENSDEVHLFAGHYDSKVLAAQVANKAKDIFEKPIHLHLEGLPSLNIEKLPDEGLDAISSAGASTTPKQLGFPLIW